MDKITFSTDAGIVINDIEGTSKLAQAYFKMNDDPEQIPSTHENRLWILKNIPDCDNVIKLNGEIIGFTFIIPANKEIMEEFINKKINENQLFERVKKEVNYNNFTTIYLCSAFVKPEFRRKGLAFQAVSKSIKKITKNRKIKPTLFFWEWSNEGKEGAKSIAKELNLKLLIRK